MRRIAIVFIVLLLASTVMAVYTVSSPVIPEYTQGGYSGQDARDRRLTDPFSRYQYFTPDYQKPYWNYGSKGPSNNMDTGMKSGYATAFNLDTNSFGRYGRNPGHISNNDPNMRGYISIDKTIELNALNGVMFNGQQLMSRGTVRLISIGGDYSTGIRKDWQKQTRSQVFIQVRDSPPAPDMTPVGVDKNYEAWVYDRESGYALSLGMLESGAKNTLQLHFEINRMLHEFEEFWITLENYPDSNPGPGTKVLVGQIEPGRDILHTPSSYFGRLR